MGGCRRPALNSETEFKLSLLYYSKSTDNRVPINPITTNIRFVQLGFRSQEIIRQEDFMDGEIKLSMKS